MCMRVDGNRVGGGACRSACLVILVLLLNGCALFAPEPGIGRPVEWSDLTGWEQDRHSEAWPALLNGCEKLPSRDSSWREICAAAAAVATPDDQQVRLFFEQWFVPHDVFGRDGDRVGLITGYYEPRLYGSLEPDQRFRFPLYQRPGDLLTIDLHTLYPELKGKRVRGRLVGKRVVPYYERGQIDGDRSLLAGQELLWVDDPFALFFLHIQGSGQVELPDGEVLAVGYADQNGHPYRSIGAELVKMEALEREQVNMFTIKRWLQDHPQQAGDLVNSNASYVFFALNEDPRQSAVGSLNVPLTAERSIAIDREIIPLGVPVWLDTKLPDDGADSRYRRLVMAQDTGGAINGPVRADLFWGRGERAERMAGLMKQPGSLYVLLPKTAEPVAGK